MGAMQRQWMGEVPAGLSGTQKAQIDRLPAKPKAAPAGRANDPNPKRRS